MRLLSALRLIFYAQTLKIKRLDVYVISREKETNNDWKNQISVRLSIVVF
tara:strand:- start:102 stop:251 length:150 start_codon:yes stop_codon:yes gene_type:complete